MWVACVSQSGKELMEICKLTGNIPYRVFATPFTKLSEEAFQFFSEKTDLQVYDLRPTPELYKRVFKDAELITLHGYLYIIPEIICKLYAGKIFNGHPGLITKYPELKGKDPQKRAYNKYPSYGCVIHEVVPEVDAGRVLYQREIPASSVTSLEDLYEKLRELSLETWISFFEEP